MVSAANEIGGYRRDLSGFVIFFYVFYEIAVGYEHFYSYAVEAGKGPSANAADDDGDPGATCPICQSPIGAGEFSVTCPKCDQIHHRECWAEIGGCGTYGCEQAPAVEKTGTAQPPLSAWGDTKTCPVCKEKIKAIALRCRYCGTDFHTVDPLSLQDVRNKIHKGEALKGLRVAVIVLFVLSLIGCLAPLLVVVSPCIVLPKHKEIAKEGPLLLVLAYSSIAISLVYSTLMGIMVLVHGL